MRPLNHSMGLTVAAILLTTLMLSGTALPSEASEGKEPPSEAPVTTPGALTIAVSIPPQAWFLERLTDGRADCLILVPPGQSPHTFEPTPRQMADLARCQAWFAIGVTFERGLLPRLERSFENLRIFKVHEGATTHTLAQEFPCESCVEPAEDHAHHIHNEACAVSENDSGEHHHHEDGSDPHIWLDPTIAAAICEQMAAALTELDPDGAEEYQKNLQVIRRELEDLDNELRQRLAPFRDETILVFHPAFGYFCAAYGLKQSAVEVDGKEPSARALARIVEAAQQAKIKVVFVQPQFPERSARQIARQIGATVVPMDPLAREYPANLRRMAESVVKAFEPAE